MGLAVAALRLPPCGTVDWAQAAAICSLDRLSRKELANRFHSLAIDVEVPAPESAGRAHMNLFGAVFQQKLQIVGELEPARTALKVEVVSALRDQSGARQLVQKLRQALHGRSAVALVGQRVDLRQHMAWMHRMQPRLA